MHVKKIFRPSYAAFLVAIGLASAAQLMLDDDRAKASAETATPEFVCVEQEEMCWPTTLCINEQFVRTQGFTDQFCSYTGVSTDLCWPAIMTCCNVYRCPTEVYLGALWEEDECLPL